MNPVEDQIDAILDRLEELTDEDALVLADAWRAEDAAIRRRAWAKAKRYIGDSRRGRSLDEARSAVGRWAAAGRSDFHGIGGLLGQPSDATRIRHGAAPAILDAVAAVLTGDALDEDEHETMIRPWQSLDADMDDTL